MSASRIDHPGHYEVMFDKSLYDVADPDLVAAEAAAGAELSRRRRHPRRPARNKADPAGRRARGVVSGARLFAAVAQRRHRQRRRSDGDRAPGGGNAVRHLAGSVCGHEDRS